jgi:hypothetical protein
METLGIFSLKKLKGIEIIGTSSSSLILNFFEESKTPVIL